MFTVLAFVCVQHFVGFGGVSWSLLILPVLLDLAILERLASKD